MLPLKSAQYPGAANKDEINTTAHGGRVVHQRHADGSEYRFNPEFPLATPRIRLHCANILIVNDNQRDSAFALAHLF